LVKKTTKSTSFPTSEEILSFIEDTPGKVGKREIARAFSLNKEQKIELKKVLRALKKEGQIQRQNGKNFPETKTLKPVSIVIITGPDGDGDICAKPATWDNEKEPPTIFMVPERRGQPALVPGDRVLARLTYTEANVYEGKTIRRIGSTPDKLLGIYSEIEGQGRLKLTNRKTKGEYYVAKDDSLNATNGDLVRAEVLGGRRIGLRIAKVIEILTKDGIDKSISQIAIINSEIPVEFSSDSINLADAAKSVHLGNREDLRKIPLVTVDGVDARDFDDAIFAEADTDKKNLGGWHLIVCIADVAFYVRPGDALDQDAQKRSNSVYFPDQVVPMLPEVLSNGWCSLKPHEDRPCMAAHIWIDAEGNIIRHRFMRGLMKSHARLTYEQLQAARDGDPDETTLLLDHVVSPLYGAYEALNKARHNRGVLELDLPERHIIIGDDGQVERVETRERFDSHKLIEEFMITANVAAAETLERKRQPCMYRIHEEPSIEKIEGLRQFLDSLNIPLAKGQVIRAETLNRILAKVKDTSHAEMVNDVVLRSQAQAEYAPDNIGHFGLSLKRYCHFTSPIRRYADLLVHRALIRGLDLGEGSLEKNHKDFCHIGETLSKNERRASAAERDAVDRFCASYLSEKVGATFSGRINGVARFGIFVTLDDTGADGLVPIRSLGDDYFVHDEGRHLLRGRSTKRVFRLGEKIQVILMEADPVSGSMIMDLIHNPDSKSLAKIKGKKNKQKTKSKRPKSKSKAGRRKARVKSEN
jgi:ribonuclease R